MTHDYSWGRLSKDPQSVVQLQWRNDNLPALKANQSSYLPYGLGRSYGDSCLNTHGILVSSKNLNRFIHFDQNTGLLEIEAGVSLLSILEFAVPRGWFLPVTPGTQFVTYGGAIANDVHGKNHHSAGTFGCHVPSFRLLRSTGEQLNCSPTDNTELYQATIGGLGLTGFIISGQLQLKKIMTPWVNVDRFRYKNFEEFCELSAMATQEYEYTVAWVDALSTGDKLGQGLFLAANHRKQPYTGHQNPFKQYRSSLKVPCNFPNIALNTISIKTFNALYLNQQRAYHQQQVQHYKPYFYPLDSIQQWNKIYGSRGFYQYQCVIPHDAKPMMKKIINKIATSASGSFLTVLKEFGHRQSPGLMSFPIPGFTFALDFPNKGQTTLKLLQELDAITIDAGGRVYPAKDARMSPKAFQLFYPLFDTLTQYIDPAFSSNFWRRIYPH